MSSTIVRGGAWGKAWQAAASEKSDRSEKRSGMRMGRTCYLRSPGGRSAGTKARGEMRAARGRSGRGRALLGARELACLGCESEQLVCAGRAARAPADGTPDAAR